MQEKIFKYKLRLTFDPTNKASKDLNFEFLEAGIDDVEFKPMETGHADYPENPDFTGKYVFASGSFFTIELECENGDPVPTGELTLTFTADKKLAEHLGRVPDVTPLCVDRYRSKGKDFKKMPVGSVEKHAVNPRALAKRMQGNGAKIKATSEIDWWQIKKVFPDLNDAYKLSGELDLAGGSVYSFDPGMIVNGRK